MHGWIFKIYEGTEARPFQSAHVKLHNSQREADYCEGSGEGKTVLCAVGAGAVHLKGTESSAGGFLLHPPPAGRYTIDHCGTSE